MRETEKSLANRNLFVCGKFRRPFLSELCGAKKSGPLPGGTGGSQWPAEEEDRYARMSQASISMVMDKIISPRIDIEVTPAVGIRDVKNHRRASGRN
jgi:hypothetical protein